MLKLTLGILNGLLLFAGIFFLLVPWRRDVGVLILMVLIVVFIFSRNAEKTARQ